MDDTNTVDFYPEAYQQAAKSWIIDHKGCALFLNMGAGKTAITIAALADLMYDRLEVGKVLVIAPPRVAAVAWPQELEKWRMARGLNWAVCQGSPERRRRILFGESNVVLLSSSLVVWAMEEMAYAQRYPFDMLVIDELSLFKNPQSARFLALRKARDRFTRVVGLTGTPTSNGYLDLFAQVWLIDKGQRLGSFVSRYCARYFRPTYSVGGVGAGWVLRPGAEYEIQEKIRDVCLYLDTPAREELPPMFVSDVLIPPGETLRPQYRRLVRDCVMETGGKPLVADNAAILSSKLLQFCSGRVYAEDRSVIHIHDLKIEALRDIVRRDPSPVLVFYQFAHTRDRVIEKLAEFQPRELLSKQDMDDWNAGRVRVLLAHPKSAGHGLNLQYGGHRVVFYGLPWSLEEYAQSCKRVHRRGQTQPVTVYRLLLEGTIDERVAKVIEGKGHTQQDLLAALKRELRELGDCP
ncbi:MAG: DEAD/DEAH box helicase [Bacteroides sp.]|nr:DEAD/DEAH box helicase [Bacteroides sp.]